MAITVGLMSSDTPESGTPQAFFDAMDRRFGPFSLDAAANPLNAKVRRHFYTVQDDGLGQDWTGTVWCNPPYGRGIGAWVEKAWHEARSGRADRVVLLVPARTDTAWWHNYAMTADRIFLIRGRLKFNDGADSAPFPSAVLVWDGECRERPAFGVIDARLPDVEASGAFPDPDGYDCQDEDCPFPGDHAARQCKAEGSG